MWGAIRRSQIPSVREMRRQRPEETKSALKRCHQHHSTADNGAGGTEMTDLSRVRDKAMEKKPVAEKDRKS